MYHGTGAISAIYLMLGGVSLAIGPRFSTSNFWKEVCDSQSTYFIYVGEIIRYLLNAPPTLYERAHRLRCCYGIGLRPDVWDKFRARFNIPEIAEFFSSSEGMFSMTNWNKGDYSAAHVGHQGLIQRWRYNNIYVPVKIDHDRGGEIWRDPKTGLAKRMPYDIGGEIIVRVSSEKDFQGYWQAEEATRKKFVRNVFKNGDLYYRTGDALRRDSDGRWSFMDRLGDTFRWKSENVSTEEVAIVLASYPGVVEANVYGVLVPGHDGRAGCAALQLEGQLEGHVDFSALLEFARARLPKYAVPVFLRLQSAGSTHTHNFKQNKLPLRVEGVDPARVGTESGMQKDRLLWVPPRQNEYVEFTEKEWDMLRTGAARL